MATLSQGDSYNEAAPVDVSGNPVAGQKNKQEPPKLGLKTIVIAIVAVVIIIGLLVLYATSNKNKEGDEQPSQTTVNDAPNYEVDENGYAILDDPFSDLNQQQQDNTSAPQQAGSIQTIDDPYAFISFSENEVQTLRGLGYTGDEIEYFSQQGVSFDSLVDDAYIAMNEAQAEWRAMVLEGASDEYKELLSRTFLGSPETPAYINMDDVNSVSSKTQNVNYIKCGVFNYQPWLKVSTMFGDLIFNVTLERYQQLEDFGNIVITIYFLADENETPLCITKVEEYTIPE